VTIHRDAVYHDGVLQLNEPLQLPNGAAVRVAVDARVAQVPTRAGKEGAQAALERLRSFRGMLSGVSRKQILADRREGLP
jgi:predicted DNA-binding antitoxin AbrB/MazE fold protein